ncbi:hypothetical protein F511_20144 [Dorcoceras hygrometricum]|uniref:Uncharacterized protein n=1 Tax=Dorcoceras hygrometricum TaxID=472368 RepID=A0A2Z7AA04_9LAMI|nr:hypothetical protein F511_20144 [Dorcoceras hygrometricum]
MDSGATWHMTSRRIWFDQYEPVSGGSVFMGNDHALEIAGVGTIKIKMFDGTICTIQEVRHVKGVTKNLLSLGQLDDVGCKTRIESGIMEIVKGALVVMKAEKVTANLYALLGETHKEAELAVASSGSGEELSVLWYRKLEHMSERGLKILSERKLLPRITKVTLPFCEHCVTSKEHRLKFGTSTAKSKSTLEGSVDIQKIHTEDNMAEWCRSSCGLTETQAAGNGKIERVCGDMFDSQSNLQVGEM